MYRCICNTSNIEHACVHPCGSRPILHTHSPLEYTDVTKRCMKLRGQHGREVFNINEIEDSVLLFEETRLRSTKQSCLAPMLQTSNLTRGPRTSKHEAPLENNIVASRLKGPDHLLQNHFGHLLGREYMYG